MPVWLLMATTMSRLVNFAIPLKTESQRLLALRGRTQETGALFPRFPRAYLAAVATRREKLTSQPGGARLQKGNK